LTFILLTAIAEERKDAENLTNQLSEKKKLQFQLLSKRDELINKKKELEIRLNEKKKGNLKNILTLKKKSNLLNIMINIYNNIILIKLRIGF